MKLTRYTDYALRVLMHLAAKPDRLVSISEIARTYRISHNHLMKVVQDLRQQGYLDAVRGRSGGVRLARPAADIGVGEVVRHTEGGFDHGLSAAAAGVGEVVRHTEGGFDLVDCGSCVIAPACSLTGALREALAAFMAVLDGYSLADLVVEREAGLRQLLASFSAVEPPAEAA